MYLRALPLLLLACTDKDADTANSSEVATFHGQAWAVRTFRPALPFEGACTRAETQGEDCDGNRCDIALADCWACVSLDTDGDAVAWGGEVLDDHAPYPATWITDLGAWTCTDCPTSPAEYDVGGIPWTVQDNSSADPWTQTATATIDGTAGHQLYQPSGSGGTLCTGPHVFTGG